MKRLRYIWARYPEQSLIIAMGIVLLAGAVQYVAGFTYILRLMAIVLAIIATTALLIWQASPRQKAVITGFVALSGFCVELFGVHAGKLFGSITYGSALGFRAWGTPLIIGVCWLVVTLSAWHIVQYSTLHTYQKFIIAGFLVVLFDLLLEQFAFAFGLWSWQGGVVPLAQYIFRFLIAQLYFWLYFNIAKKSEPSIFIASILPMMSLFFWLMLLFV